MREEWCLRTVTDAGVSCFNKLLPPEIISKIFETGLADEEEGDEEPETPAEAEEDLVRTCLMRGLPS